MKVFIIWGSINAFLSVALGAFAAHWLQTRLTLDMLEIFRTGIKYHMMHALGLILVGILGFWMQKPGLLQWAGWLILAGIVLFSGTLYVLSISGIRWFGAVTPLGGICFLTGWILVTISAIIYLK
jgi:uncharacterized membrane protein YgdD (TMEM256/DUF423 family)